MILRNEDLQPFFSPYLQGGYKRDVLLLSVAELTPPYIDARLDVAQCFTPADGEFHLTVPLAFIWIAQLGIIYGCLDNGLSTKEGEVYLRKIELTCKQPIKKTRDIFFHLEITGKKKVPNGVFYRGNIDIEHQSFVGFASFVLPLESHSPENQRNGRDQVQRS